MDSYDSWAPLWHFQYVETVVTWTALLLVAHWAHRWNGEYVWAVATLTLILLGHHVGAVATWNSLLLAAHWAHRSDEEMLRTVATWILHLLAAQVTVNSGLWPSFLGVDQSVRWTSGLYLGAALDGVCRASHLVRASGKQWLGLRAVGRQLVFLSVCRLIIDSRLWRWAGLAHVAVPYVSLP